MCGLPRHLLWTPSSLSLLDAEFQYGIERLCLFQNALLTTVTDLMSVEVEKYQYEQKQPMQLPCAKCELHLEWLIAKLLVSILEASRL